VKRRKTRRGFTTPFKSEVEEEEKKMVEKQDKEKEYKENPLFKNISKENIERIENEILKDGLQVRFSDIAGLDQVKQQLIEMVIQPALAPHLFTGIRKPPSGLLLFGPPGKQLVYARPSPHILFFREWKNDDCKSCGY